MKNIFLILKLIPILIKILRGIEEEIPGAGNGSAKLAAVKKILDITLDNAEEVWPSVEKIVGILVSLFNDTGTFKKP